jgi:hypothetical protein
LFNPNAHIAIARKTFTEGCETLGAIRKLYDNDNVRALYVMAHGKEPAFTADRGDRLRFDFNTSPSKEGSIDAFGIDSAWTGKHYDKIVLDDVITLKDRISRAVREHTKEAIREIITNIVKPDGQVCHAGTPWHKDDGWTISPEPILKFDYHKTGILTAEQVAMKKSQTTPSLWAANYELLHQADDHALFRDPKYDHWQNSPMKAVAHLDAAFGGDCFNGFTIMRKVSSLDDNIQAIGKCWEGHIKNHYIKLVNLMRDLRADTLYVETNADKGFVAEAIREVAKALNYTMKVVEYREGQNKDVKIATNLAYYWPKLIWDHNTDDDYIAQIVDWREGAEPNDCPDSAASLLRQAFDGPQGSDPLFMYR